MRWVPETKTPGPEGHRAEYPREQNWPPHGSDWESTGADHRDGKHALDLPEASAIQLHSP